MTETSQSIYRLRITLAHVKPQVWREVDIPSHYTLDDLHEVIQIVMDWEYRHMWEFRSGKTIYRSPEFEEDSIVPMETSSATDVKLNQVLKSPNDFIHYIYDFGDDWLHEIVLKDIIEPDDSVSYPRCISGENAAPPEDCGGPIGYLELIEALKDKKHPEHEMWKEWAGDFDAQRFDLNLINEDLQEELLF